MDIFVARQPIFERDEQLYGYELLYRSSVENLFTHSDGDMAASVVINDSMFVFGLDTLSGGKKAFINVTRNVLIDGIATIMPNKLAGIEILETVEPDEEVIAACRKMKEAGYLISLDDFVYRPEMEPLIALADIIKIDFQATTIDERISLCKRFRPLDLKLLAEKVETHVEFEEAKELGFDYFQGYFFCRPEIVARKDIPGVKLNYLRFMHEINRPELNFDQLEKIIKHDLSLSYRLLRYINSAYYGWQKKVTSIKHALVLLGERPMKKWASLAAFTSIGEDKPPELVSISLIRARFCEVIGMESSFKKKELDLFLMGMLSVVDVLVDRPLDEILDELMVSDEVKKALLEGSTAMSKILQLIIAYERGNWEQVIQLADDIGIDEGRITQVYCLAVEWADQVASPVSEA